MKEEIESICKQGLKEIENAKTMDELQEVKRNLFGKSSKLSEITKSMGTLAPEMKKEIGIKVSETRNLFNSKIEEMEQKILESNSVLDIPADLTIPGKKVNGGTMHPIIQMCYDLNDAFASLGFEVFKEAEISSEKYAFDNLNFPPDHPARQTMDTYWLEGTENNSGADRLCLRPHLTGASVRYLLKHGAPARFVYPGQVFRNEDVDARHERDFFQYEALIVDKDTNNTGKSIWKKSKC